MAYKGCKAEPESRQKLKEFREEEQPRATIRPRPDPNDFDYYGYEQGFGQSRFYIDPFL